jgi:hypothetical protein
MFPKGASATISEILSLVTGVFLIIVPFVISGILSSGKGQFDKSSFKQRHGSVYAYFDPSKKYMHGVILWNYAKKIIYVLFLIVFPALEVSGVQIILLAILVFLVEF